MRSPRRLLMGAPSPREEGAKPVLDTSASAGAFLRANQLNSDIAFFFVLLDVPASPRLRHVSEQSTRDCAPVGSAPCRMSGAARRPSAAACPEKYLATANYLPIQKLEKMT